MQGSNVSTLTPRHCGTIYVAVELSQRSWLVTIQSPDRDRFSHHQVEAGNHVGLLALIERVRERAARALGDAPTVVSCYEAGYDGFWLHRVLTGSGITNHVFDPASIAVDQRLRRAKSDRIDNEQQLRTLMAYCRGEPRVVRIVRVPTPDQEDARRATREHDRLVKEQTAHQSAQGAAAAFGHGGGQSAAARLAELGYGALLVREQLEELAEPADEEELTPGAAEMVRRRDHFLRLKSLGPAFSGALTNEVFYKDFHNGRQVGSYFGLAPSPWKSGGIDREQGISKAGNPRARQKAIELSWLWLRHQPDSALAQEFRRRTANASGRIKRIAIVALARKLMVALWRYLTTGLIPQGAVLKPQG